MGLTDRIGMNTRGLSHFNDNALGCVLEDLAITARPYWPRQGTDASGGASRPAFPACRHVVNGQFSFDKRGQVKSTTPLRLRGALHPPFQSVTVTGKRIHMGMMK